MLFRPLTLKLMVLAMSVRSHKTRVSSKRSWELYDKKLNNLFNNFN